MAISVRELIVAAPRRSCKDYLQSAAGVSLSQGSTIQGDFYFLMQRRKNPNSSSVYTTREFWERLWRAAGLQFVGFFILSYLIYGNQPQVGASTDSLVAFYHGDRLRILIAVVFAGLNVLNLMWFAAALRITLADEPKSCNACWMVGKLKEIE
jgi:hypothetical protein